MRPLRPLLRSHLIMVAIIFQSSSRAFHRPLCQNRTIFKELRAKMAREVYTRYSEIRRSHFFIVAIMAEVSGSHFFSSSIFNGGHSECFKNYSP